MTIHIKTAHGVSNKHYGGTQWTVWPHGIGQGNGHGPVIWALISSPLLKIMRYKGFGTSINSPISNEKLKMAGFSSVDDTDQCKMTMKNKDWHNQLQSTQKSLDLWESLLRTTGGAIEPTKSDWTKLKYIWVGGKAKLDIADPLDKLYMRNPDGEVKELIQKDPTFWIGLKNILLGFWGDSTGLTYVARKLILYC